MKEQKRIIIYPGSHGQDSDELITSIKQAAERAGMSVSGWARDRLKKQAKRETKDGGDGMKSSRLPGGPR